MTHKKSGRIRKLLFGAAVLGAGAIGAVSFAGDDADISAAPNPKQVNALVRLVVPPVAGSFAIAEQSTSQGEAIVAAEPPWTPEVRDCVDRLDAYIEPIFITFEEGDAQIMAENAPLLSHLAALVASCEDAQMLIAGHASGSGDDLSNLTLSWERADETLNLLVTLGVDPAALEAVGYGARAPLAQGSVDDEDGANRRVDFRILRKRD